MLNTLKRMQIIALVLIISCSYSKLSAHNLMKDAQESYWSITNGKLKFFPSKNVIQLKEESMFSSFFIYSFLCRTFLIRWRSEPHQCSLKISHLLCEFKLEPVFRVAITRQDTKPDDKRRLQYCGLSSSPKWKWGKHVYLHTQPRDKNIYLS